VSGYKRGKRMSLTIKRDEVSDISKKLTESKKCLREGNLHACLLSFKGVLEKTLETDMLPSDEKELSEEINIFQTQLSEYKGFKDTFGPVTFQDSDPKTTLDFLTQLIIVEEDEIPSTMVAGQKDATGSNADEIKTQILAAQRYINDGDYTKAGEIIDNSKDVGAFLLHSYNRTGIRYRKDKKYDEAIGEFKKAIFIRPDDEGLRYNTARSQIEKGEWRLAEESIKEALKINPDFKEGRNLLKHIQHNLAE